LPDWRTTSLIESSWFSASRESGWRAIHRGTTRPGDRERDNMCDGTGDKARPCRRGCLVAVTECSCCCCSDPQLRATCTI